MYNPIKNLLSIVLMGYLALLGVSRVAVAVQPGNSPAGLSVVTLDVTGMT